MTSSQEVPKIHIDEIRSYFRIRGRLAALKEELERLERKYGYIKEPRWPFFDGVLCSCGAVLPYPSDIRQTVTCDCGNVIRVYIGSEGASLEATNVVYVSDYLTEYRHLGAGDNVVVLRGAASRHWLYQKKSELLKSIQFYEGELQKAEERIAILRKENFKIVGLWNEVTVTVTRDNWKRTIILKCDGDILDDERQFIESSIRRVFDEYELIWRREGK